MCPHVVAGAMLFVAVASTASAQQQPASSQQFGGPASVGGQLHKDDTVESDLLTGYFALKDELKQKYAFSFAIDYNALYQGASESAGDEDAAAGGAFRAYGQWTLTGRDSDHDGSLVYKVENRHRLGTEIAPQDLGTEIGYAGLTGTVFSDMRWALTNLYWEQNLASRRVGVVAGIVDPTDYVNVYGLVNPWADSSNLAFLSGPTIPVPNQGMGAAVRISLSDSVYVLGGLADTNAEATDPWGSVESFFDDREYFTHVELGWISSFENRFSDNVHVTFWHADERERAEVTGRMGRERLLESPVRRPVGAIRSRRLRRRGRRALGPLVQHRSGLPLSRRPRRRHRKLQLGASLGRRVRTRPTGSVHGGGPGGDSTLENDHAHARRAAAGASRPRPERGCHWRLRGASPRRILEIGLRPLLKADVEGVSPETTHPSRLARTRYRSRAAVAGVSGTHTLSERGVGVDRDPRGPGKLVELTGVEPVTS